MGARMGRSYRRRLPAGTDHDASASGGLPGLGAGNGKFSQVAASPTDLVFGLLSEEWGLIIAILAVLCIITLGVFAVRSIIAGRSTYYSIAACAATSMFIFQTILNVFGSVDLLPLTGVTFPFVSSGGTSMLASWGLLSFLKAADTRQNAASLYGWTKKENSTTNWKAAGWKIRKTFSLQSMGTGAVIRKIATIETTIMPALQALRADLVLQAGPGLPALPANEVMGYETEMMIQLSFPVPLPARSDR